MKLKVCGMKYEDNIGQVGALQPDYLGFIFYEKTPRHFDTKIPNISDIIKKTGVFVNEDISTVIKKINEFNLQAIQLHGEESPYYCSILRTTKLISESKPIEIIKVFPIKDGFNFEVLEPYEDVCDYFLFDTKGKLPGGNGYRFDWSLLDRYPSTKPFFLSGGIGLAQVEDIKKFKESKVSKYCYALDINSKFEKEPGLKNISIIREFKNKLSDKTMQNYNVNEKGYYGEFGGAFIQKCFILM